MIEQAITETIVAVNRGSLERLKAIEQRHADLIKELQELAEWMENANTDELYEPLSYWARAVRDILDAHELGQG